MCERWQRSSSLRVLSLWQALCGRTARWEWVQGCWKRAGNQPRSRTRLVGHRGALPGVADLHRDAHGPLPLLGRVRNLQEVCVREEGHLLLAGDLLGRERRLWAVSRHT